MRKSGRSSDASSFDITCMFNFGLRPLICILLRVQLSLSRFDLYLRWENVHSECQTENFVLRLNEKMHLDLKIGGM